MKIGDLYKDIKTDKLFTISDIGVHYVELMSVEYHRTICVNIKFFNSNFELIDDDSI